ncbi:MAG: fructan beta-fructosidase [Candidatus Ordinivivax streblomastigis]|uniref:Fructan beta-fructosidase n=1 Tax=Candidatus Ordinivivax streblomastigis TaxID=2540710 RepID=A0A5M8NVJ2_9BACT|nr:MAG: fructan beta-fructosidase [Candidatus Ordinivivax streblomastigis]
MKNLTLLFFLSIFLISCENRQHNGTELSDELYYKASVEQLLIPKADKKYLLLPIEDTGEELKTSILVDGQEIATYIIRLAKAKIDYWMPLDLSEWRGKDIRIHISGLNESAVCLKEIKLSDTFDFESNEKYRPAYHFTPPYGWMNDPNGMVYYAGEYHLFYQYNPFGTRWQNMSWGHAVSTDLVHWEHLPIALKPDSLGTIFSGSAVVDENNTAGFQTGSEKTLLAFFTHSERQGQFQSLAYSNDKGRTWTKYANNPILKHSMAKNFRDPKVFWHNATRKWIMVLAVGQIIEFYSSTDAKEWTYESNFGKGYGSHDGVWECPDLFELPVENTNETKWALIVNINPGGPMGGSATQYFVGNFDGKTFTATNKPEEKHWLDWGKDHYAAVTWSNAPDNRRIAIAWMNNWDYANDLPTQNFRGATTVPRELKLQKQGNSYLLANYPVKELENLRQEKKELENIAVVDDYSIDKLLDNNQGTFELVLDIENQSAEIIGFKLFNNVGEFVDVFISLPENKFYVMDRKSSRKIDFSDRFASVTSAPIAAKKAYKLRLLIDKASIECFEGEGEISMTNLVFPSEPYNRIGFYANGGKYTVKKFEIYNLKYIR